MKWNYLNIKGRRLPRPRFLSHGFPAGRMANAEAEAWEVFFGERRVHGGSPLSCLKIWNYKISGIIWVVWAQEDVQFGNLNSSSGRTWRHIGNFNSTRFLEKLAISWLSGRQSFEEEGKCYIRVTSLVQFAVESALESRESRCQKEYWKDEWQSSLVPAVKLSGRVSIYEPLYYCSELLLVFLCCLLKFRCYKKPCYYLRVRERVRERVCECRSLCRARSIDIVTRMQQYIHIYNYIYIYMSKGCCRDLLDNILYISRTFGYCQVGPGSFFNLMYTSRSDLVLHMLSMEK